MTCHSNIPNYFTTALSYRDKLLDFTMAESDPKITFEQTPTRINDEDMSNIVHRGISDCSNSIPVEHLDFSKEGGLLRVFTTP
jgi:hypothetical protein